MTREPRIVEVRLESPRDVERWLRLQAIEQRRSVNAVILDALRRPPAGEKAPKGEASA